MRCRHTVPDWHRYVETGEAAMPILAACRLLIKDGDRVRDPRSIACAFWGHQEGCPLYDGPGKQLDGRPDTPQVLAPSDEPAPIETVWPVRLAGAADGPRVLLIALSALSVALLIWTAALGLMAHDRAGMPRGFWVLVAIAVAVSVVTHILALLRTWARR
jgi:hypothetical protein